MKQIREIEIGGLSLPLIITYERRRACRVSLVREGVRLRIPRGVTGLKQDPVEWAVGWLRNLHQKNPDVLSQYAPARIAHGKIYHTPYGEFVLSLGEDAAQIPGEGADQSQHLIIDGNPKSSNFELRQQISRALASACLQDLTQDVMRLNRMHFRQDFNRVRLKYNRTNWGSCSAKGNLNFSTRLLLTPRAVLEYVIIHELAHLRHLNHSRRFWRLVEDACPEYKVHVHWLRDAGASIDF